MTTTASRTCARAPTSQPALGKLVTRAATAARPATPTLDTSVARDAAARARVAGREALAARTTGMTPPSPAPTLASPTVMTMHDYRHEHGVATPTRGTVPPTSRLNTSFASDDGPRRHSTMFSPSVLAASLALADIGSSPASPAHGTRRGSGRALDRAGAMAGLGGVVRDARQQLLEGAESPALDADDPQQQRILNPLSARLLGGVPYAYTHERLKIWGGAYLGNEATADAFVKAVPLPRSGARSGDVSPEAVDRPDAGSPSDAESMLVQVRVRPRCGARSPFLLYKKFNIAAFPSRPRSAASTSPTEKQARRRRSVLVSRSRVTRAASSSHRSKSGSPTESTGEVPLFVRHPALVVHVEYALHGLPLLAAILLSGKVLKGDTVELPLPKPDVWPEVVRWMYLGDVELTDDMLEDVVYLAGKPD
ncbi:MAG: hypothetical protein M1832_005231 [Thelocarpon impressellum]|nr:MAG: hypothetical protein M1832_005231 [Thelocarpon impressellum]